MEYNYLFEKRLNRYGTTPQDRIQGQREKVFADYLNRASIQASFEFQGPQKGILKADRQDETKTRSYLLTDRQLKIPNGTLLDIEDNQGNQYKWMVYWEQIHQAKGYNKYVLLRMTHKVTWQNNNGQKYSTDCYFYGQEDNMLKSELKSRSRSGPVYNENLKMSFFVAPFNNNVEKGGYIEIAIDNLVEAYVITGYDILSTPQVMYVTVDPQYKRDTTPPKEEETNPDSGSFWLQGR